MLFLVVSDALTSEFAYLGLKHVQSGKVVTVSFLNLPILLQLLLLRKGRVDGLYDSVLLLGGALPPVARSISHAAPMGLFLIEKGRVGAAVVRVDPHFGQVQALINSVHV
jgi:hypothetical protein